MFIRSVWFYNDNIFYLYESIDEMCRPQKASNKNMLYGDNCNYKYQSDTVVITEATVLW